MTTNEHTQSTTAPDLAPPAPTVWPTVSFTDVDTGVRLLTEVLGFVVTALHRSDDGTVEHAEARWPDGGGVMFGSRGKAGDWGGLGAQGVYVVAAVPETVDAIADRVRAAPDLEIREELTDTDYGSHQFGFRDSDGNLWSVGTYRGQ
ncbi:putative glyoxalase superfamily protein PhnB [Brevibacterium sanguinis]|uniref:Glyoxalase superfamily protein PhnB n=2 Tax=Brevibacterium TaxID=1696 RepID=A0ABX9GNQ2_9MICO|nr:MULTISPECIES: VOC family protein [Brevibacterium]RBP64248.1 putative glyoxalase superfamily protein PhnB [Brevibacterium sanguinis]RBP71460.1 putative glyoxalase superfamily protein PhnB [Brevibacterium celere]